MRRRYRPGTCKDCGHQKKVTTIKFWATGLLYVVCSTCIKPYRNIINK